METVLEVKNLTKAIGRRVIIDNLSFSCRAGEIYGFLGLNGAGKTSTLKLILGLWSMDGGSIRICGRDLETDPEGALLQAGGVVDAPAFYESLSGLENLRLTARAWGGIPEERLREAAELVGLKNRLEERVKRYSLGMKQRLGLARALLPRPRLLLLDEPTNSLDPAGTRELRELMRSLAHQQGICIVLSSHHMNEMELICDRAGILGNGRLLEEKALLAGGAPVRRAYRFEVEPMDKARQVLADFPGGTVLAVNAQWLEVLLTGEELEALNRRFLEAGAALRTITPVKSQNLEEMFLEVTGGGGQLE